jgi:hypothetical protein
VFLISGHGGSSPMWSRDFLVKVTRHHVVKFVELHKFLVIRPDASSPCGAKTFWLR